ncbi:23S rRNA (uracil-5-)-methyltransferase RumA-like protein [Finegoldia magna SY403409CC001050417]|uniref:23S rRNA (Uracil(1939)-C(5))-methyltransferase RlmD n=1 Tax=Finegoldia magna TaxID=1260 RepID=A0A7D4FGI2_FINMA|nr:23S rRNA (uracil(1939)-C(5))-methyltransferase RlmD [Finegoldia magna]EGS35442.1 23S rRNA (uracil-5-)-methyltransferase RumA-like protein [Finegoldia magna SY403409CC001050417]QKH78888.1 23S rRNA (uracil(1939)-C(5))-methyltransferase RlmD [Finegoldia magna]
MKLEIIDMIDDGRCVAKYEGKTVFVDGGSVGEIIEAKKIKEKKNLIFATKTKTIQQSPHKQEPLCPHFYECDGCSMQDITYEKELEIKKNSVLNKLQRIAKLDIKDVDILTNAEYYYRNKVDLKVENGKLGYYNRKTHNLTQISTCKIASKAINEMINWLGNHDLNGVSEIKIRSNYNDEIQISLDYISDQLLENLKSVESIVEIYEKKKNFDLIYRKKQFVDKIGDLSFIISPKSFFQVNKYNTSLLYDTAKQMMNAEANDRILDLYCGIGTTTMYIGNGNNTIGVEVVKDAVKDANENKKLNNLESIQFIEEKSENVVGKLTQEHFDVILVDPPRKGMDEKVVDAIIKSTAKKLIYISCDPATLARDLKALTENGFAVRDVKLVDMFAKTMHVETVALLSKLDVDKHISVEIELDEMDLTSAESKATYAQIKEYVWNKFELKVSTLYIAQIKRKCGIELREHYNKSKKEKQIIPQCTPEKEEAIMDALRHFKMI